jgi:hypothetical protein
VTDDMDDLFVAVPITCRVKKEGGSPAGVTTIVQDLSELFFTMIHHHCSMTMTSFALFVVVGIQYIKDCVRFAAGKCRRRPTNVVVGGTAIPLVGIVDTSGRNRRFLAFQPPFNFSYRQQLLLVIVFWGSKTICVLGVEDDVMWLYRWSMWLCMGSTMVHCNDKRVAQWDISI